MLEPDNKHFEKCLIATKNRVEAVDYTLTFKAEWEPQYSKALSVLCSGDMIFLDKQGSAYVCLWLGEDLNLRVSKFPTCLFDPATTTVGNVKEQWTDASTEPLYEALFESVTSAMITIGLVSLGVKWNNLV